MEVFIDEPRFYLWPMTYEEEFAEDLMKGEKLGFAFNVRYVVLPFSFHMGADLRYWSWILRILNVLEALAEIYFQQLENQIFDDSSNH